MRGGISEPAPPVERQEEPAAPQQAQADSESEPPEEEALPEEMEDASVPASLYRWEEPLPDIDPARMEQAQLVDGWVYFLYPVEFEAAPDVPDARALFRRREDGTELTRLSSIRCVRYDVVDSWIYYDNYPVFPNQHGALYRIGAGEDEPVLLAEELGFHQVLPPHIYYWHSYDTIGVGIEGHALHRMDLDGSNPIIVAYETVGPGVGVGGHFQFRVEGDWVLAHNLRIRPGEPADGTERVELTGPLEPYDESHAYEDDGWFYYTTNRLMRSRPDGSEQQILDGDETTWLAIDRIEGDWIFYHDQGPYDFYKIRRDGSEKTAVERSWQRRPAVPRTHGRSSKSLLRRHHHLHRH